MPKEDEGTPGATPPEADGEGATPPTPPPATGDTLGDAGKAALDAERKAAREARAEAKAAQETLTKLRRALDEKQTDEQTVAQARAEADAAKAEALRYKVAAAKGLPADLIPRLVGDTEEALAADADALLTLVKKQPKRADAGAGNNGEPKTKLSGDALLRAALGR